MQSQFLTKNERALVTLLKEGPRQYTEIIDVLKKEIKDRRTVNKLLNELEDKKRIFRVEIDRKVFYRLNIFPDKIQVFFNFVDQLPNDQAWQVLRDIKNEMLRKYPGIPFEKILKRNRTYLELTRPQLKGIIKILKDFEGDCYEHSFG